MKAIKNYILPLLGLAAITGCQYKDILSSEQYEKSIYIVGANQSNNEGLSKVSLPYKSSGNELADTYISLATGGSLTIDHALTATVVEAGNEMVNKYNSMYLYKPTDIKYQMLGSSSYSIPDFTVKLSAGDVYGNMPIHIKTFGLSCDSLYALTFRIASVSEPDYLKIRTTDTVLMFSFNLYNDYSGTYQEAGKTFKYGVVTTDTATLSLSRVFKATDHSSFRFIHLANTENVANAAAYGVKVTVNTDNTLTIAPWGTLAITAGGGTYNPTTKVLDIWYNYNSSGTIYTFKGTFTKSSS